MTKPRITEFCVIFGFCAIVLQADDISIESFHSDGRLTWTNTYNGLYTVQWASSLSSNTTWNQSWSGLQAILSGGAPQTTVEVPMFFRIKCETNPFTLFPVGHGGRYLATNALVNNWTQQVTCVTRMVLPSLAKEFTLLEQVDPRGTSLAAYRATESAVYGVDLEAMGKVGEALIWTNGPVGMVWTNYLAGNSYQTIRIDANNETVAVPAGSFSNCFRFHSTVYSGTTIEWDWWVNPRYGLIQFSGQISNSPALFRLLGNF